MNFLNDLISSARAHHIFRFLVVGVINTVFSYLVYALCLYVGFKYQIANLIALVLGIIFSFKTQGRFVFKNTDQRLIGRFVMSWAFIYFFTIILIGRIIELGFSAYWAGIIALPFTALVSYLVQKYIVFKRAT